MSFPTNIVCCTRDDGTKYLHKCECPEIKVCTEGTSKFIVLCGYSEFVASTPPKKFRERRVTASASSSFTGGDCSASTGPYPTSSSGSDTAFEEYIINDDGVCLIDTSTRSWNRSGSTTTCSGTNSGTQNLSGSGFTFPTAQQSLGADSGGGVGLTTVGNNVTDTSTTRTSTASSSGPDTSLNKTHTLTLSVEDTEALAEDRTEATVLSPSYSTRTQLNEDRVSGFSFTKRELNYCILLTELQPQRTYSYQVARSRRTYTTDAVGAWEKLTPISGTFIPTKRYHLIDGTLNENITDEQFEEQDYSLNPTDYGLASTEKVLTSTGTVDFTEGFEQAFSDNTGVDNRYVQVQ